MRDEGGTLLATHDKRIREVQFETRRVDEDGNPSTYTRLFKPDGRRLPRMTLTRVARLAVYDATHAAVPPEQNEAQVSIEYSKTAVRRVANVQHMRLVLPPGGVAQMLDGRPLTRYAQEPSVFPCAHCRRGPDGVWYPFQVIWVQRRGSARLSGNWCDPACALARYFWAGDREGCEAVLETCRLLGVAPPAVAPPPEALDTFGGPLNMEPFWTRAASCGLVQDTLYISQPMLLKLSSDAARAVDARKSTAFGEGRDGHITPRPIWSAADVSGVAFESNNGRVRGLRPVAHPRPVQFTQRFSQLESFVSQLQDGRAPSDIVLNLPQPSNRNGRLRLDNSRKTRGTRSTTAAEEAGEGAQNGGTDSDGVCDAPSSIEPVALSARGLDVHCDDEERGELPLQSAPSPGRSPQEVTTVGRDACEHVEQLLTAAAVSATKASSHKRRRSSSSGSGGPSKTKSKRVRFDAHDRSLALVTKPPLQAPSPSLVPHKSAESMRLAAHRKAPKGLVNPSPPSNHPSPPCQPHAACESQTLMTSFLSKRMNM